MQLSPQRMDVRRRPRPRRVRMGLGGRDRDDRGRRAARRCHVGQFFRGPGDAKLSRSGCSKLGYGIGCNGASWAGWLRRGRQIGK